MLIKTISDYYEDVHKLFPRLPDKDIKRILNFGFKSLYLHNSYGGDTLIKDGDFWCYIGFLRYDSLAHFHYYIKKLIIKIRVLSKRKNIPWDGYYYFALNDKQWEEYQKQKKSRGRPKKWFKYGTLVLYKLYDECYLRKASSRYFFRVPFASDIGISVFYKDFRSDRAELIDIRNPLKFEDILITNHKYKTLNEKRNY